MINLIEHGSNKIKKNEKSRIVERVSKSKVHIIQCIAHNPCIEITSSGDKVNQRD